MGLADIALAIGQKERTGTEKPADIIDFAESEWGLGMKLFPVQRVILKAHYGLALDDTTQDVVISDWRREKFLHLTEAGYLRYIFDEGRCNIREVVPGQERRELVLSIGRRSGKCVTGDSLVLTDKGLIRIDQLGDPTGPELQPSSVQVAQEEKTRARAKWFYNGGVKPVRKIQTYCGYHIAGTDNHRIQVLHPNGQVDWKYLADIEIGDFVALHRGTDLWASDYVNLTPLHADIKKGTKRIHLPAVLDENLGLILGYLVGDGTWTDKQGLETTVALEETREKLRVLYYTVFGSFKEELDPRTRNTGNVKFFSVEMRELFHRMGFRYDVKSDTKEIPWVILRSPRSVVQAFLRGLFETDGGTEKDGMVVSFCSASKKLADVVQILLLNFGITCRNKTKRVKNKAYYVLSVYGRRSRERFASAIGFDSRKKSESLSKGLARAKKEGKDAETVPNQRGYCVALLRSVQKKQCGQGWSRSALRAVLGNVIKPSSTDQLTYPRAAKAIVAAKELGGDQESISHFERLVARDYFYDEVTQIEENEELVYDLNVPEGEMFVANGVVNHNTTVAAIITAYEVYKLLLKEAAQTFYGLPITNQLGLISVATDKDQAGLLYIEASGHFNKCPFFKPYLANNTQSYAKFQTPFDIKKYGRYVEDPTAKATIKVSFKSCVAKGLRGAGNIVVILDELAHFNDGGQSNAENIYSAVRPSISAFSPKDPKDSRIPIGPVEGRIVSISSPLGRQGHFYTLFQIAMRGGRASENMLAIQAPTWEVNPSVPASEFEVNYAKNATTFFTEYGAEFTDRTRGWIEKESDLVACIDPALRPLTQAPARRPHYMAVDVGLVGNGTAVAIGHLDERLRIVVDLVDEIKAGEGTYKDKERLDFDEVANWIHQFTKRFYIVEGIFDQWAGIPFEQALHKKGLNQMKAEHMTKALNSQIFQNFKDMLWDGRLVLYDWPVAMGKAHCGYIQELLELQAEVQSKYVTTVAAPNVDGKFDDRSDALVRMVWIASKHSGKSAMILRTSGGGAGSASSALRQKAYRQTKLRARQTGSSPERQVSKMKRLGGRR